MAENKILNELTWNPEMESICLTGIWNLAVSDQVIEAIDGLITEHVPVNVRLDFTDLEYLDSSAVSALISLHTTQKNKGRNLIIIKPQPIILKMLQLIRLDQIVTIES